LATETKSKQYIFQFDAGRMAAKSALKLKKIANFHPQPKILKHLDKSLALRSY